jgi:diguanylate cyclase (GGDEF)-like protein/PAS domain S-box-containing protein
MIQAVPDEQGRLNALKSYAILDTPRETDFDLLVRLAAQICQTPIAKVSFVDEGRQWFKAAVGLDMAGTDRAIAFCAHAIAGTELFLVPDACDDPRFAHNPLVTGTTGIRFYAGMPLVSPDGFALGTLAVIDRVPRTLSAAQTVALSTLARQVMVALEYRRLSRKCDSAVVETAGRLGRLEQSVSALWEWDLESDDIRWNGGIETLFGVPLREIGAGWGAWKERLHPDDKDRVDQRVRALIDGRDESWVDEYRFRRQDGSYAHLLDQGFVMRGAGGRAVRLVGSVTDHTARRQSELERDKLYKEKMQLLACTGEGIWGVDSSGRCTFASEAAARMLGYAVHEMVGKNMHDVTHYQHANGDPYPVHDCPIYQTSHTGRPCQRDDEVFWRKNGSAFPVRYLTYPIVESGSIAGCVVTFTDITQRKAAENEIRHLAFYDSLTGLPNRQLLLDRLQHALAVCSRSRSTGALLFIDLDNFKTLNDTLGHEQGDQLLRQVGMRLVASVRNSDTVARLGGDEFVVMVEDLARNAHEAASQARCVGEQLLAALNLPYLLGASTCFSSPSIGITLFNDQDADVGEQLKRADLAMYQAKAAGRNTLRFFDADMQTAIATRAALEADMRHGLERDEFLLHYQPQVDVNGDPTGAEALVRWRHPRRGLVSPAEFIPLAEETGLILPLGQWVLETACTQLASWGARRATAGLSMAVNVSARQFRHPDFVRQVLAVVERTGANPRRLKLELTEGLLIDNVEETVARMIALKAQGVGFALDDFGTGYSSLAYLKRLPLDQLKIDQSFVRDVLAGGNDATIARTIITLGKSLGLAVIAEGVETEAQRDFLAHHHCDAFQGYLFSRPIPADLIDAFMAARAGRRPSQDPGSACNSDTDDPGAAPDADQ